MLETIKKIILNTSDSLSGNGSNRALAEYYQSRLQTTNCVVEVEAILSMNTLMWFSEHEEQQSEQSKWESSMWGFGAKIFNKWNAFTRTFLMPKVMTNMRIKPKAFVLIFWHYQTGRVSSWCKWIQCWICCRCISAVHRTGSHCIFCWFGTESWWNCRDFYRGWLWSTRWSTLDWWRLLWMRSVRSRMESSWDCGVVMYRLC